MLRHAFMIMAHQRFDQLEKLVALLDDPQNEIFLHVDRRADGFDAAYFEALPRRSRLTVVPGREVNWGGYSQIGCELALLKAALPSGCDYYHLLSGADLPIKPMRRIHAFFEENAGKEFVCLVSPDWTATESVQSRVRLYHPLQERLGQRGTPLRRVNNLLLELQKKLKVDRLRRYDGTVAAGSQWFSITRGFASYLVGREKDIRKLFRWTTCCDELFLQMMLLQSPLCENRYVYDAAEPYSYKSCARLIRFEDGVPHTFRMEDYPELISAPQLFARKFDPTIDADVIDRICAFVSE